MVRGVAGQRPRVVCEIFLENNVRGGPLRPARGLGGAVSPQAGFGAAPRENFENPENLTRIKQSFSNIF